MHLYVYHWLLILARRQAEAPVTGLVVLVS